MKLLISFSCNPHNNDLSFYDHVDTYHFSVINILRQCLARTVKANRGYLVDGATDQYEQQEHDFLTEVHTS